MPALSIIRLPRDHTAATRPGYSSPRAMVADNDYALGQLVETVSHSKVWPSTAIFVLEDDAQSGHDHVDAHRSLCAVISPWARRGAVDHRFYNTDSVLRTIEALLGLPPMCHYDATASILDVFDTRTANLAPYTATMPAPSILAEVNQPTAYRAAESAAMDLSAPDRVPDALLNDIVWHAVKGADSPEPLARHGLRVDGDDDD